MWAYSGLALETRTSADYRYLKGQLQRSRKQTSIRGLNKDHNHDLKGLSKAAATNASVRPGPFQEFYDSSFVTLSNNHSNSFRSQSACQPGVTP